MLFRQVNLLIPGTVRRVQKNTQYQQATPLDYHTVFLSGSPAAACQGESLKPSENEKGESNNVEVYLWSISRWHYRSKTSGKAVKTAEQTARTSIKTSEQTANASV